MTRGLRTLPEALAAAAETDAGYTFVSGPIETRRAYGEIRIASLGVARSLREAGLGRGDLVALVISGPERFLTAFFGVSIAGMLPAPLDPPSGLDLQSYFDLTAATLRASRARAVITTPALVGGFDNLRSTCPDLALSLDCERLDAAPLEPDRRPSLDDIAFVQYTSGSTSAPKGVVLSHRNLSANVDAINEAGLGTTSEDSALSWLPLSHDMGLVGMALGPLYSARPATFLMPQAFVKRPADWLKAISRFRAAVSFAPNFAYDLVVRRVKDRDLEGLDLSCWRVAGCGAEPIHGPTLAAFAQRFRPAGFRESSFLPCYGLAEHVLAATFPPRDRVPRIEQFAGGSLVSCGRALPQHRIQIVGEDGREVSERTVGEIALAGPSVMLGYHHDPALTAETIRDGWLHTGDLGFMADGELFVCGRLKDIVILNGRKYHPPDLEWAVAGVAGVRLGHVAAFGISSHGAADRLAIVVETGSAVALAELRDAIRGRIADAFGLFVDEVAAVPSGTIGWTASGKIQRAVTRARYEDFKNLRHRQ